MEGELPFHSLLFCMDGENGFMRSKTATAG